MYSLLGVGGNGRQTTHNYRFKTACKSQGVWHFLFGWRLTVLRISLQHFAIMTVAYELIIIIIVIIVIITAVVKW